MAVEKNQTHIVIDSVAIIVYKDKLALFPTSGKFNKCHWFYDKKWFEMPDDCWQTKIGYHAIQFGYYLCLKELNVSSQCTEKDVRKYLKDNRDDFFPSHQYINFGRLFYHPDAPIPVQSNMPFHGMDGMVTEIEQSDINFCD